MLRDINLKSVYRSENDDLFTDFYLPCLRVATRYDRAVGYFSSAMLAYAAQGLPALVERKGSMRLVFGAAVSEQDVADMKRGYRMREAMEALGEQFVKDMKSVEDELFQQRLSAVALLIANGTLEVKIAITQRGIYHEKLGVFVDGRGDSIVFAGSANESRSALLPDFNFEAISVYPSWRPELNEFYDEYAKGFTKLWNDEAKKAKVVSFPDAAKQHLLRVAESAPEVSVAVESDLWRRAVGRDEGAAVNATDVPALPAIYKGGTFQVRRHQREALNQWQARGYLGILALATGAGKTVTALYGLVKLYEAKRRLAVVIAVPYINLAEQWADELREFNIVPILCYGNWETWSDTLQRAVSLYNRGSRSFLCVVAVNATLKGARFQAVFNELNREYMLLIGDECHHHGTTEAAKSLPSSAAYKMGLSATPFDVVDENRNETIADIYGSIAYEYGLADALADGVLAPYNYHVHVVALDEDEIEEYEGLSSEIGSRLAARVQSGESGEDKRLDALLMRRARLLGSCRNKLKALRGMLSEKKPQPLSLFYCGDGSVTDEQSETTLRQVDAVSAILAECGWKTSQFTSRETKKERRAILDDFRIGTIDGVVAIRCLDEGVDVPGCHAAYLLASSRNPRQFIQRRGRVLRPAPGKECAEIHDFLVHIPKRSDGERNLERNLVRSELERVGEFVYLASNFAEATREVWHVLEEYSLTHKII